MNTETQIPKPEMVSIPKQDLDALLADLTYRRSCSLFTMFFPETKAGEAAWRDLAAQTDGTGKVPHQQVEQVITELRKAGYSVKKVKDLA